ncbi:MAG: LysM peptidoglycan-binding domain-containing protein, partial [Cyclobacteriaceae bacterium]
ADPVNIEGKDKVVYRVRSGDFLGKIAENYKVRVSDIRRWNNLRSNMIRIGQRLTIYVNPDAAPQNSVVKNVKPVPVPGNKVYIVQPGDTLWQISRKYEGLSIQKIKELNNLKDSKIKPGMKLVLG